MIHIAGIGKTQATIHFNGTCFRKIVNGIHFKGSTRIHHGAAGIGIARPCKLERSCAGSRYSTTTPHLRRHREACPFTNREDGRAGSITQLNLRFPGGSRCRTIRYYINNISTHVEVKGSISIALALHCGTAIHIQRLLVQSQTRGAHIQFTLDVNRQRSRIATVPMYDVRTGECQACARLHRNRTGHPCRPAPCLTFPLRLSAGDSQGARMQLVFCRKVEISLCGQGATLCHFKDVGYLGGLSFRTLYIKDERTADHHLICCRNQTDGQRLRAVNRKVAARNGKRRKRHLCYVHRERSRPRQYHFHGRCDCSVRCRFDRSTIVFPFGCR